MTEKVAVVFGTYQRLALLRRAVASVRLAVGRMPYKMIIVDGGSTDGSRAWLAAQKDVVLIQQSGPLTGAVRAFNLGFGRAVDEGFDYVVNFNDDAEFITPKSIENATMILKRDRLIGQVAFEMDLRRSWGFDHVHGKIYANYGCARRDVGMMIARKQGDVSGRNWWNPIYRTYAADTEFSCWIWRLGFRVHEARGLRIHDHHCVDALRKLNRADDPGRPDSKMFNLRWPSVVSINPVLQRIEQRKTTVFQQRQGRQTRFVPISNRR